MNSSYLCRPRCRSRGLGASLLGLAALLVVGAVLFWAPWAQAGTQTSGSILLQPDCCQTSPGATPGQTIHIGVNIQSTSQIGGTFVDASVVGTTTIILGCTSSTATSVCFGTELGALTFDSCTPAAGVASCAKDPNDANRVLITYPAPGGKDVTTALGGTPVATITAHFAPGQQIANPSSGKFFLLGNTGGGNLTTTAANGDAGGSAPLFYPFPPPTLTLTKSCVATFNQTTQSVDVTFTATLTNTDTNEGITNVSCTDAPTATLTGAPTVLATGGTAGDSATFTGTYSQSSLSANDTLTCSGQGASSAQAVSQQASASCVTDTFPAITVAKSCSAAVNGTGTAINVSFSGTVTNSGTEDLNGISCSDVPGAPLSGVPTGTLGHGTSAGPITGSYSVTTGASGPNTLNDTLTCSGTGAVSSKTVSGQGPTSCQATLSPSITLAKSCTATFNQATQSVDVTFTATLTNSGNEAVNGIGCNDSPTATLSGVQTSLAPGGTATITGTYNAGSNLSPSDSLTCSGTSAISSTALSQTAPASCSTPLAPQATLSKSCMASINEATQTVDVSFTATLQNTGSEGINNITCTDSPAAATLTGVPTGTLAPGGSATITGTYNNGASSAASDTLTCTGAGAISTTSISTNAGANCSVTPTRQITVAKTCTNVTGTNQMNISAKVCNGASGPSAEALNTITCTDNPAISPLNGVPSTLAPGACATVTGTYTATSSSSTDTLTCTGTGAITSQTTSGQGSATCSTCACPSSAGFPFPGGDPAAFQFTVFALNSPGPKQTANFSLVTVNGDVGIAGGATLKLSSSSIINGDLFVNSGGSFTGTGKVNGTVSLNQDLSTQRQAAFTASANAAALAPNFTFNNITSNTTVTGVSGLNVVQVKGNINLSGASLTLSGPADAFFVVNVAGSITLGGKGGILVGGNVPASHLLINMTGSGKILNTKVGNVIMGTLLGVDVGGTLDGAFGQLILGEDFTLMSNASVTGCVCQ